jgi:MtfA peptidase
MLRRRRPRGADRAHIVELVASTCPLRRRVPADLVERHHDLTTELVSSWRWEGERGSDVPIDVRVMVAGHAALTGVGLPDAETVLGSISPIIIHRRPIVQRGPRRDGVTGVVTEGPTWLSGQAHHRGPVLLDVGVVRRESRHPERGQHVVIHEIAHRLDMLDGITDGTPPLGGGHRLDRWIEVCTRELTALRDDIGSPVLRPYAATNPAEFFAVASESFWCRPGPLATHHADLFEVLVDFYGLVPVDDTETTTGAS